MRKDWFGEKEEHSERHREGIGGHFRSGAMAFWKDASERHFGGGHFGYRFFDHGELRFVILKLIAEKPSYGYELIKTIEDRLGGAYSPSPGIVYPTLTMLEEMGFAAIQSDESGKKLYSVTTQGREFLETNKEITGAIFARMEHAAAVHGRGRAPQIVRAIQNLRFAIKLKTSRGSLTDEQVRKIADTIDEAAKKIEQC